MIVQEAAAQGVDPSLAIAVANAESGGNQNAVSSAGAIGVFQLMPATAAGLGVDPTVLAQNIHGGILYLRQLIGQYGGDLQKVLAAYNWGPGNVNNAVAAGGASWFMNIPSSVQRYASCDYSAAGLAVQTVATSVLTDLFGGGVQVGSPTLPGIPGSTAAAVQPAVSSIGLSLAALGIVAFLAYSLFSD